MRQVAVIDKQHPSPLRSPARIVAVAVIVLSLVVLTACGGGSSSKTDNTPSAINPNPLVLSLNLGDVAQGGGSVVNSSGTLISNAPVITFTSSNTSLVTVSS